MTKIDTGIIPQELEEEDELTAEQLQMLGIEEYPPDPEWVSGNTQTTGFDVDWDGLSRDLLNRWLRTIETENEERAERHDPLVFGGGDIYRVPEYNPQPIPMSTTADRYAGEIWYDESTSWLMVDGNQAVPAELNGQTGLNIESPTYENLQEAIREFEEDGES